MWMNSQATPAGEAAEVQLERGDDRRARGRCRRPSRGRGSGTACRTPPRGPGGRSCARRTARPAWPPRRPRAGCPGSSCPRSPRSPDGRGWSRSWPTTIRPARSCSAPVAVATAAASGGACNPRGPQHACPPRSRVTVPSWSLTSQALRVDCGDDRAHVQLDAQLATGHARPRRTVWGRTPPAERSRRRTAAPGPPRARICRYSRRSVLVATSRICPASSTPVGPAPTRAKVSHRRRSAGSPADLGQLERAEHPAPDFQRVLDGLHPWREPGVLLDARSMTAASRRPG